MTAPKPEAPELLPCPFCGEPPFSYTASGGAAAACDTCGIEMLADAWTLRADLSASPAQSDEAATLRAELAEAKSQRDQSLHDHGEAVDSMAELADARDDWKDRAEKAEAALQAEKDHANEGYIWLGYAKDNLGFSDGMLKALSNHQARRAAK